MTLAFTGRLDRAAVRLSLDPLDALVAAAADRWSEPSALPGMTVGGLARHLVSQAETVVEFLGIHPYPPSAPTLSLRDYADRLDWLDAPVDAPENTSIVADFEQMAAGGAEESLAILRAARDAAAAAVDRAEPTTYVPWQDCVLATDDFLAVRLLEIVVHADDLAASLGVEPPAYPESVTGPVLELLLMLAVRKRGVTGVLRALARTERAPGTVSAF